MSTVVYQKAFEGDLLFMRSFKSITPVGENPTTKSYFENVDIQVLLTLGVRDIWNNSTFHSEFGGHFVF